MSKNSVVDASVAQTAVVRRLEPYTRNPPAQSKSPPCHEQSLPQIESERDVMSQQAPAFKYFETFRLSLMEV
jgi:hypothetical protein